LFYNDGHCYGFHLGLNNLMPVNKLTDLHPAPVGLILDMDGVLWRNNTPIGDLAAVFRRIHAMGLKFTLATNNSTKSVKQYQHRLNDFGAPVEPWQIVTSSHAVADMLAKKFPERGDVFLIGEDGIEFAIKEKGFNVVPTKDTKNAIAVVVGLDREINFNKLKEATLLIRRGLPFYGTNSDLTFPTPEGLIPGAGSFLALINAATGVDPIVAGKPAPFLLELALARMGTPREKTLVVGDRLETDIAGGQAAGCPTALVLSGVSTREMGEIWEPKVDLIADDLMSILD
jgi:4-nitrophenyl phosphatase